MWLTCCKCQRLSHLECVRNLGPSAGSLDCSLFICNDCCNPNRCRDVRSTPTFEGSDPSWAEALPSSDKSLRPNCPFEGMSESSVGVATGFSRSSGLTQEADQEAVAAANIVAALAANEAKDAKAKAKVLAVAAVKAAARAKAALDAAYRARRDEVKWRVEAIRNIPAVTGPHPVQLVAMTHNMGGNLLEKENLETAIGANYQAGQLPLVPADEEELVSHMSNVAGVARSSRTANPIYRKRPLSSIAASEPMQPPLSPCGDLRQGAGFLQQQQQLRSQIGTEVRQFRLSNSAREDSYQLQEESPTVALIGSEGFPVSDSQANTFDGAETAGSSSMASHVDTVVGFPEMRSVTDSLCSSFLPGNGSLGAQVSVSASDSVVFHGGDLATDGSDPVPLHTISYSMAGTPGILANQANSKELKTFSQCTGEASPNDLLDVESLSPWRGNEEAKLSNGFVAGEQASALHCVSGDSVRIGEERIEKLSESEVLARSEKKAHPGVVNHLLGPPEESNGAKSAAGQGIHVSDESLLLANKAFTQKNQRSVLLHMSASNHGDKPIPYSMANGSVSTACSVPLQTTALTSVPTGPNS